MSHVRLPRGPAPRAAFHTLTVRGGRARSPTTPPRSPSTCPTSCARRTPSRPGSRSPCAASSTARSTAAPTRSAPRPAPRPRIGVREIPGRAVLLVAGARGRAGRRGRGADAAPAASGPTRPPAGGTCASPPGPASRRCCRSRRTVLANPSAAGDAALRQPDDRLGDVRRGAGRPQEPLRRRGSSSSTSCPASRATSSCSPAGSTPTGCAGCSTALVPVEAVDHVWLCGPFAMIERRPGGARASSASPAEKVHFELFYVDEPPPRAAPGRRGRRRARRASVTVVLDGLRDDRADAART